jgi:hypothetical protein
MGRQQTGTLQGALTMKIKNFYANLIAWTVVVIGAIQIYGIYLDYQAHEDYYRWRNGVHALESLQDDR